MNPLPLDTIHVLHVDDEPDFADMAATFLEKENERFTVETASSAAEGLERFGDEIDCIVSDYDMPGKNGIEFLESVRAECPDIPFILYTGKGSEEVASDAISAGVTDYLQKETGSDQYTVLANRIENAVRQTRSQEALEASEQRLSLFIEQSPLGVIEWDENCDVAQVNDAATDILGYTEAELKGESWESIVVETDREEVEDVVEHLLDADGGYHSINKNQRKDGSTVTCEWHNRVITDDDGETLSIFSQFQDITARREHERELQIRATAMEAVTDGIAILDEDQEYVFMNEAHAEIYGYDSPDALLGETWRACYDDVDTSRFESEILPELYETGEWRGEMNVTTADGRDIVQDLLLNVTAEGRVVCVVRDITKQKEHEAQFKQSKARLEALFENSPDMINIHDMEGNIIDPNPVLCEETGYDEDELTDMKVWDLDQTINPDEARSLWEGMNQDDRERLEGVYQRRDGSEFPVEVHVRRLDVDEEDRFLAISREITERKDYLQQLQRERDRFQAVFEEAFDAMVLADDEGQYIEVNQSATELFGLSEDKLLGRSIREFAPEDFDFEAAWREFQQSGKERGTFPLVRPDGDERIVEYAATWDVIPGQHLSVLRDVTEREQREQRLHRQNERLENVASVVSHDLRNPLNVADGNLELAREECDSEYLERVDGALDRMEALIADLLTLAREGETVSDFEPVDLAVTVESCWANVKTGKATLITDVDRTVYADRSRLMQVVENIVRNAVEHGGEDVTVTVGELDDGFYVEDDGSGIPETEHDDVFDAGYSANEGGTGFGLSIVKQIVNAHDWEIRLTEGSEGGARFEITGVKFSTE